MTFELCESRGFDTDAIAQRLSLVGLARPECRAEGKALQNLVVKPNVESILDEFYASMDAIEEFRDIIASNSDPKDLRAAQQRYLLGLGVDFDQQSYFEDRLRIGSVHQRLGVPQSLYQCSFRLLQCLLIRHIPQQVRLQQIAFEKMIQFVLKVTALDMSLAIESYCADRVFRLENLLNTVRGESERLQHLAVTDWLTDLHNHSYSRQRLADALETARTEGSPLCVIMADLDHFKKINDEHGHLVGDQVLRIAAARMTSGARANDEIGRYGGEEFLFILQDTDIGEGIEVAERVRTRINSDAMRGKTAVIRVSLSLGIAQAKDSDDVDSLIDRADAALYEAKFAGRDCVRFEPQI